MNIVDISTPGGFEAADVSIAKEEVYDELYEQGLDPEEADLIRISDRVVNALINLGWRPTD